MQKLISGGLRSNIPGAAAEGAIKIAAKADKVRKSLYVVSLTV